MIVQAWRYVFCMVVVAQKPEPIFDPLMFFSEQVNQFYLKFAQKTI